MKKVFCTKCECWSNDPKEVVPMERGELDNRCPICGAIDCLVLVNEDEKVNDN